MSTYNFFGLTYLDILNSFQDVVISDFDTNSISGSAIIEKEMELAESEIVELLSAKVTGLLSRVDQMKLLPVAGSTYQLPFPVLSDFEMFSVPAPENNEYTPIFGSCSSNNGCSNFPIILTDQYVYTDYTMSGSVLTLGSSFNQEANDYYVSYNVNNSIIELPSLQNVIRNIVCCSLGRKIYSTDAEDSKYIIGFCDKATSQLAKINEYYIPAEFRNQKWLNPIIKVAGGISSIRIARS